MSIPISETGLFRQNTAQWSGDEKIDSSQSVPILNELNWSVNPNTYKNGQNAQSFWSPAEGSDLIPVIWNDFTVLSATANFNNNGNSASSLNLKLIPNKTFFDRKAVTNHYSSGHDINVYNNMPDGLKQRQYIYNYVPNRGYQAESNFNIYKGNVFSNFDYKSLNKSDPRYNEKSFTREDYKSKDDDWADPNLISPSNQYASILSPDGLPLFFRPWYTRIGEPADFSIYNKFKFGGIISSWKISKSTEGFYYECVITDPTEILKSVNIIVGNYKGPSGYFNVINALGYFEAMNYGLEYNTTYPYPRHPLLKSAISEPLRGISLLNEGNFNYNVSEKTPGMRIGHIAIALSALLRAPSPIEAFNFLNRSGDIQTPRIYGGPIVYGPRETMNCYAVDLSIFNFVQENYFVQGNSGVISLYDLFSMIVKDIGCDMVVTLENGTIIPKIIDRRFSPRDNVIASAVEALSANGSNVLDASYGYELIEQNVTGQLLIGSPKEVFYQTSAIRPVYGSYRGNPILGTPGRIKITLPNLVQFDNSPATQLGEIGSIVVSLTKNVNYKDEKTGKTKTKKVVFSSGSKRIGFHSKYFDVEFVKIPLPEQLVPYFGPTYVTNTLEMMVCRSEKGAALWEKLLRFSKKDIWAFLYGMGDPLVPFPQMPKDHSQTSGTSVEQIYGERLAYEGTLSKDELSQRLFQVISSYAQNWGKYFAVSLPDKANIIGPANEYNISSNFRSINPQFETSPPFSQRKLHYEVKSDTYIDANPYWQDSNIYNSSLNRSTVVNSYNFPVGNSDFYPMGMPSQILGEFLSSDQKIGPVVEYSNLVLKFGDVVNGVPFTLRNILGYSGNDFLNGVYPNPANDSLVAKANLSEKLTFMNPDFTNEFDFVEPLNSLIALRPPQLNFGVGYEETFYTSDTFAGAYNDIVVGEQVAEDTISAKVKFIVAENSAFRSLQNPELNQILPDDIDQQIARIYSASLKNKVNTHYLVSKPYIYGYFTVVEVSTPPLFGMSKKAELQEFMMFFEGLTAGNIAQNAMNAMVNENVFPFRVKGPPITPTRIGVPLSLTFDNWVFRDDADAYGKNKYPCIGKVEVEIDENLNPSSYGGLAFFFAAARAKIRSTSPQRQSESGSITFFGLPSGSIGNYLAIDGNLYSEIAVSGGPALTGINISFDADKISTTYEFKNFAPRFGVTSKEYIERIKSIGNEAQKARMIGLKAAAGRFTGSSAPSEAKYVSRYHDRQPPHELIYFRQFDFPNSKLKRITAKSATEQEVLRDIYPDLNKVALASWDAFLAPYSLRSMAFGYFNYAYGISATEDYAYYEKANGQSFFQEYSVPIDTWGGFKNPKINLVKGTFDIDFNNLTSADKENIEEIKKRIEEYKTYLTQIDIMNNEKGNNQLTLSDAINIQLLEDILYDSKALKVSINSATLNPVPKEYNVDSVLNKRNKDYVGNIRGSLGNADAKYVTSVGLKGPLIVTGWGADKHFSVPGATGGIQYVGTGVLTPSDFALNPSGDMEQYSLGRQSHMLTGPVDLLWDSYRGTWSTKDTELVYVKSYEKMPSGHFGYLANCIPLNFIDDFNSIDNLKTYPIVAAGISGSPAWKDNLKKINSGTGDGFKCFYSIKPQTGSIYTATFMNNSVSSTSGICLWMLNTESPIVGVYSSGSIYDMFNRRFDENIDFIHPIDFIPNAAKTLAIVYSKLENNILTLTYVGGPSRFTIGDKIKINFNPPDPTYDGTFIITNVTSDTISYAFNGEDFAEGSDAGLISEPENIEEIRKILLTKAKEKNSVLLKVFPGSKATYTVMKGGGSTEGGPVCNVECVGNILTVTYC